MTQTDKMQLLAKADGVSRDLHDPDGLMAAHYGLKDLIELIKNLNINQQQGVGE